MLPIILASSSSYRCQLLARLELDFHAHSPAIDETPITNESPKQLVSRLAKEKAQAVTGDYPQHLIIGSDQVACIGGTILGKPGNAAKACEQLAQCSGQSVTFLTSLALLNSQSGQLQLCCEPFTVQFRTLSPALISDYVRREQPYDCAGSFKVEGLGIALFEKLQGEDPNSLVGLPLIRLIDFLANEGVSVFK